MGKFLLNYKKRQQGKQLPTARKATGPGSWVMRQLNPNSGSMQITGHRIAVGIPKFSAKLFPGQTMRLNTGWNIDSLPDNSILTTVPHPELLSKGILALPTATHSEQSGS